MYPRDTKRRSNITTNRALSLKLNMNRAEIKAMQQDIVIRQIARKVDAFTDTAQWYAWGIIIGGIITLTIKNI